MASAFWYQLAAHVAAGMSGCESLRVEGGREGEGEGM